VSRVRAEIIAVGTELLLGQTVNTNAAYLATRLAEKGVDVFRHTAVGDNLERAAAVFAQALRRADLIIATGGLGTTEDDLSRDAAALALGIPLVHSAGAELQVRAFFERRGLTWTDVQFRQCMVPSGGHPLPNPCGTAPGILCEGQAGRPTVILLPGPPIEMRAVFDAHVLPWLEGRAGDVIIKSRKVNLCGISEPAVEAAVLDLIRAGRNPTIAPLAHGGQVTLRATVKASTTAEADAALDRAEAAIRERLGAFVFGVDEATLEEAIVTRMKDRGHTVTVAESCTGGLLCGRLTSVPGSSAVFPWGVVVYSNRSKVELAGVAEGTLEVNGAVSERSARELAEGVRARAGATFGIGVTGIAGPGGATATKPIGLAHLAVAGPGGTRHERHVFAGARSHIRHRIVWQALVMLWREVGGAP
jgi:nicotinamide-nucleotide amidase